MITIGLTGPIASGKSTVARLLAERGAAVIDCDQLAHEVTAPGTPGLAAVIERFGPEMILADGSLDRAKLGRRVFRDPHELADLEAIVHPLVTVRKDELLAACTAPVAVIEAIKLIEAGYHEQCDRLWVVTAPVEVRLERLARARRMSAEAARARVTAQGDEAAKLALADEILVNTGDLAGLRRAVEAAWSRAVDRG